MKSIIDKVGEILQYEVIYIKYGGSEKSSVAYYVLILNIFRINGRYNHSDMWKAGDVWTLMKI